ncbi:MAG: agmatinase, partial [Chryseotalea sp.]
MTKQEAIEQFDPNAPGATGNLFGLPFTTEQAELVLIPVPWEVTVSYSDGTANGPQAILDASAQVDLFVKDIKEAWKLGVSMLAIPADLQAEINKIRELEKKFIES